MPNKSSAFSASLLVTYTFGLANFILVFTALAGLVLITLYNMFIRNSRSKAKKVNNGQIGH